MGMKAIKTTKLKQHYRPQGRSIRLPAVTLRPPAVSRWSVHTADGKARHPRPNFIMEAAEESNVIAIFVLSHLDVTAVTDSIFQTY
jgi:hypothetical protein